VIKGSDVTVLIPTIEGREEMLRRAYASVTAQRVQPGNVVVQLDSERHGAHAARNAALKAVMTDWVAFLDDDDEFCPNHLKVLVRGANKSHADMVFTYANFIGSRDPLACWINGQLIPEPINVPWSAQAEHSLRTFGNFIPVTYMVKTELVRRVGGFPAPYAFDASKSQDCEDYGLLLRLLNVGAKFHHVTGVRTWNYNVWGGNVGGRGHDRMAELHRSEGSD
jgi:glycosyltransferase involved in cell wall biosynthesis